MPNNLYCFPCILFSKRDGGWATTDTADLAYINQKIVKHELSTDYINASTALVLFGKTNIKSQLNSVHRHHIAEHNEMVKKPLHFKTYNMAALL